MALMPGLQLNIGQQLKLTPQLQQSIKILQYSALEVQQAISTTLESNFMLEADEEEEQQETVESIEELSIVEKTTLTTEDEINLEKTDTIAEKMDMDYEWEDVYSDYTAKSSKSSSEDYALPETYTAAEISLRDKLYWQSDIYQWQDNQEVIASYIIDSITDEGFLEKMLDDILVDVNQSIKHDVTLKDLQTVLSIIQDFEPIGVAARDLSECLCLQLRALESTPLSIAALRIITERFELLTTRNYKKLKKIFSLNDEKLTQVVEIIQSLNPRPGRAFSSDQSEIIIPDLKMTREKDGFIVSLNQKAFPRLSINSMYINLTESSLPSTSADSKKIKEQLVEAKGLIKSIQSRGETLLRVGRFIIEKQSAFFEEGEKAMRPMVLGDVAEVLELHESTISRATSQKYMQTPRGTFELKYFFSTGLAQYGNSEQSAIAIKYHIKQLIDKEACNKPLSDSKLMRLLEEQDISVARRTIAKYREAMNIPSSSTRKQLNKRI